MQRPLARHDQLAAIPMGMLRVRPAILPLSSSSASISGKGTGNSVAKQFMGDASDGLFGRPAVEGLEPMTPEQDLSIEVSGPSPGPDPGHGRIPRAAPTSPSSCASVVFRPVMSRAILEAPDDPAALVMDRRHGERDLDDASILSPPFGLDSARHTRRDGCGPGSRSISLGWLGAAMTCIGLPTISAAV